MRVAEKNAAVVENRSVGVLPSEVRRVALKRDHNGDREQTTPMARKEM
jgi:hypothetical protein